MAVHATTVDVTATVTLWVPLDASGDLKRGVEDVLDGVEGVENTSVYDVTDVSPRATDIQVTAIAGLTVADAPSTDAGPKVRDRLTDGFGVMAVERLTLD
jgi:hypothetical protein